MNIRPFAYNTGTTIDGTIQVGDVAIGRDEESRYQNPGDPQWWMGPVEDEYFVLAAPDPTFSHTSSIGINAGLRFIRSSVRTDASFIETINRFYNLNLTSKNEVIDWLISSGFASTYPNYEIVDVDTMVYLSGLTTSLSITQIRLIDRFVVDLKHKLGIGRLSEAFDVMYILAGETPESSLRNLVKREHDCIAINSPMFSQYEGYSGNGTSQIIRTNYIPSGGTIFQTTNASIGVYSRTDGGLGVDFGSRTAYATNMTVIMIQGIGGDNRIGFMLNSNASWGAIYNNNGTGMYIGTRSSSSVQTLYRNKLILINTSATSSKRSTVESYILGFKSGEDFSYGLKQISFAFMGKALTEEMINHITDTFEEYMDARGKGVIYEPETYSYISGLTTTLSQDQVGYIDEFIVDIKTGLGITGLTDAFDVMYILAGETSESSLRNLVKREHDATAVNSPAFTQYEGYQGNGTSTRISTDYLTHEDCIRYSRDDASVGFYSRTDIEEDTVDVGFRYLGSTTLIKARKATDTTSFVINNGTVRSRVPVTDSYGLYVGTRTSVNVSNIYKNTIQIGTNALDSSSAPTGEMNFLCHNNNNTYSLYSNRQLSFGFAGKSLTVSEQTVIKNAFENYMSKRNKGVIWEPEIVNYLSGLTYSLSYDHINNLNTLVVDLKTGLGVSGLTEVFDVFYVLAGETEESSLRNLVKREHNATMVNSPYFVPYEGFKSDVTTSYINTNYNPSTESDNYSRDSAAFGHYSRTDTDTTGRDLGISDGTYYSEVYRTSNNYVFRVNADLSTTSAISLDGRGMFVASRTASDLTTAYVNNVTGNTTTEASRTVVNQNFYILCRNSPTGAVGYSDRQLAFVFFSRGLMSDEVSVITNAFEKYMDANGKGVIT